MAIKTAFYLQYYEKDQLVWHYPSIVDRRNQKGKGSMLGPLLLPHVFCNQTYLHTVHKPKAVLIEVIPNWWAIPMLWMTHGEGSCGSKSPNRQANVVVGNDVFNIQQVVYSNRVRRFALPPTFLQLDFLVEIFVAIEKQLQLTLIQRHQYAGVAN